MADIEDLLVNIFTNIIDQAGVWPIAALRLETRRCSSNLKGYGIWNHSAYQELNLENEVLLKQRHEVVRQQWRVRAGLMARLQPEDRLGVRLQISDDGALVVQLVVLDLIHATLRLRRRLKVHLQLLNQLLLADSGDLCVKCLLIVGKEAI